MWRVRVPAWFVLATTIELFANGLATSTTTLTIGLMHSNSEFASAVRAHDLTILPYYRLPAFAIVTTVLIMYFWPVMSYWTAAVRAGRSPAEPTRGAAPLVVRQRVISGPLFAAALGFAPWFLSCLVFPASTLYRFGTWSPDLMSQQVLSPLVNGFLAATTSYLLLDWLFRVQVVPRIFPTGRCAEVRGPWTFGVRGRLIVFLVGVAFIPLFTLLGLVRAAASRVAAGVAVEAVIANLARASEITFVVYLGLGVGLTLILARTLTRPLSEMAAALRRVQRGDLDVRVQVGSSDEVGILEDGVNAMVGALREKEHILQTFGRVVEPSVRDQLLSGALQLGGELRPASVLFCDLRGFTALAERTPPSDIVTMLNQFFAAMTGCVRACDGFVDKFIGDAIMAVFGLFDDDVAGTGAAAAMRCGMRMHDALREVNATRATAGEPPLAATVSVHTGDVLAGRIGAEDRHEYTVIGDTVNVAARLLQLCKEQGHDMIVSEFTYELARANGAAGPVTAHDVVILRGRQEPVRVFAIG